MSIDPLSEAEKLTEKSYKTDKGTESLGFGLHLAKAASLKKKLDEIGDTQFSESAKDYIDKLSKFDFKVVFEEKFTNDRNVEETLYILFRQDIGVIIKFDTYTWEDDGSWEAGGPPPPSVNGGSIYYNWSPNNLWDRHRSTSSGSFIHSDKQKHIKIFTEDFKEEILIKDFPEDVNYNDFESWEEYRKVQSKIDDECKNLISKSLEKGKVVWVGDHDCRQGVISIITNLMDTGTLIPNWVGCQFNWILNYMDHKKDSSNWDLWKEGVVKQTNERIDKFPQEVKDCINNTYKG